MYPVYILIIAYCHCSMSVYFHCRALRAFTHVCISTESFWGSYPDPLNKYISTIICAFISIHHHRPSAQATPMLRVVVHPQQKSGTQCGTYSWWLPSQKHINIKKQHVGQLPADLKAIQKSSPFDKTTAVNVWLFNSSQQTNFDSAWHHHKVPYRWNHVLKGSAHTILGDARSDTWRPGLVPPEVRQPWQWRDDHIPAQEVRPPTDQRCDQPCWQLRGVDTVQWTICCARGTWHWLGAGSTELCVKCKKHWTF